MQIPSRGQCLRLMDRVALPVHIRHHSFRVAQVAMCLGQPLVQKGFELDLMLLEAGALLHDIAKGICLDNGGNHADKGAQLLTDWGYPAIAPIVADHVIIHESYLDRPVTEAILVNYADKRVRHEQIVDLRMRFDDLVDRYARNQGHRDLLLSKLRLYLLLERRLFEHLPFAASDLARLCDITVKQDEARPGYVVPANGSGSCQQGKESKWRQGVN